MIPGLPNQQGLQADAPGVYRGQCTQYCGTQHAHMALEVVAQRPADFAAWRRAQQAPLDPRADAGTGADAGRSGGPAVAAGRALFMERCAGCHAVRGTEAAGQHGPDLTHLGARRLIAAGLMSNTPAHLTDWIVNAQRHKPGARMPSMPLDGDERRHLGAFLHILR